MRLIPHLRILVMMTALASSSPVQGLEIVCPSLQRAMAVHECCCLQQDDGRADALRNLAECCCQLRPAFVEPGMQSPAKLPSLGSFDSSVNALWTLRPPAAPALSTHQLAHQPPRWRSSAPLFLQYRSLLI